MEPFVALMRRYVVDYTNRGDLTVCDEIMEPDYVLRMGPHVLAGRDDAYKPATRRQLEQFPGLVLTVHDVITDGRRLALHFSEHGASRRHDDRAAVWGGIGLYTWNGTRLTANRVEQDYLARRRQLADGVPDVVPPPALAPWDTVAVPAEADTERVVRAWAGAGLPPVGDVVIDDGRGEDGRGDDGRGDDGRGDDGRGDLLVEAEDVTVDDVVVAGTRAAVHVTVHGPHRGAEHHGAPATLHAAALVTVEDGRVARGRVIRDRLGLVRALAPAGAR